WQAVDFITHRDLADRRVAELTHVDAAILNALRQRLKRAANGVGAEDFAVERDDIRRRAAGNGGQKLLLVERALGVFDGYVGELLGEVIGTDGGDFVAQAKAEGRDRTADLFILGKSGDSEREDQRRGDNGVANDPACKRHNRTPLLDSQLAQGPVDPTIPGL